MPNTNLDDLILAEYASGTLGEAQSVLVASHLTLCPESRKKAELLDQIGGLYISEAESSSLASNTFDKVIARIDDDKDADCKQDEDVVSSELAIIPKPIRDRLPNPLSTKNWKRLGKNISYVDIPSSQPKTSMRLMKLSAGTKIPVHSHNGNEYTMVIAGGFSDHYGSYERGDVAVRDESDTHQPIVDDSEDCICFIVTEAPLKIKGLAGFIISKILG